MTQDNTSRGGHSFGPHKPGSRAGKGFKPRNGGRGRSYGGAGGASHGQEHGGEYHKDGGFHGKPFHGRRDARGDEGSPRESGERRYTKRGPGSGNGGYRRDDRRSDDGRRDFHRDGARGGYRHDNDHDRRNDGGARGTGGDRGERRRFGGGDFHRRSESDRRGTHAGGGYGAYRRDGEHRDGGHRNWEHRDGEHRNWEHRDGGHRDGDHRDGERQDRPRRDDRHAGYQGARGSSNPRYGHDHAGHGGYGHSSGHDGDRRDFHRDFHRDGERGGYRHDRDGESRGDGRRTGYRHDGDRRDFHRGNARDDRPRGGYRGGPRKDFPQGGRRGESRTGSHTEGRRPFNDHERDEYRETKRRDYMDGPRRNSDGTMSFPSQNPYTDRRPGEPKMPKGIEWSMLSKEEKERLRGLAKEHAENIGLHILAAYALEEQDPQAALEHAKWAARQASRIDFSRETLAFIAYRQGDYKLALKEFRTAHRMNGYPDYLPFIADCERGVGNPRKAIETALSDEGKQLQGEAKAEMFLVYAGALGDLELWDKAIDVVHRLGRSKGLDGAYRMRAIQAEQYFLEEAGRSDEADDVDQLLEKLELQYADDDEDSGDVVIDYDLEDIPEDMLSDVGIEEDDARYASEDEFDGEREDRADDDPGIAHSDAHSEPVSEPASDDGDDARGADAPEESDSDGEPEPSGDGDSSDAMDGDRAQGEEAQAQTRAVVDEPDGATHPENEGSADIERDPDADADDNNGEQGEHESSTVA